MNGIRVCGRFAFSFIQVKHGIDAFLVLLSDGVSYSINDQECIDFISQFDNPIEAAQLLTDQALHFGSEDNSTAVVVPFGAWGKYSTLPTFNLGKNILFIERRNDYSNYILVIT